MPIYREPFTREWPKQLAVWCGIVALLPLAVCHATGVFSPPPDWKGHANASGKLRDRILKASGEGQVKLEAEKDRLDADLEQAERAYYRAMFWVAYPVGFVAFVVGTFVRVQAVGAGLMFGGSAALSAGCYSYWDRMGDGLRFGSLLVALAVTLALGIWRFRQDSGDTRGVPND